VASREAAEDAVAMAMDVSSGWLPSCHMCNRRVNMWLVDSSIDASHQFLHPHCDGPHSFCSLLESLTV
jgi:hypothetical protein